MQRLCSPKQGEMLSSAFSVTKLRYRWRSEFYCANRSRECAISPSTALRSGLSLGASVLLPLVLLSTRGGFSAWLASIELLRVHHLHRCIEL